MTVAWCAGSYLLGSVPFGLLIGFAHGVDIRLEGSRNIGATNCGRVCGPTSGVLAFLLDLAKGFLPVWAAVRWLPAAAGFPEAPDAWVTVHWIALVAVGLSPILGHVFPIYIRFRGGKAVATSLGVLLAMPMLQWTALAAFGVWILVALMTRYVAVASTVAALAFLAVYLGFNRQDAWAAHLPVTIFVLVLVVMVIVRHRSNYVRLWKGQENRIGGRKEDVLVKGPSCPLKK
jgi:glycerol-3-phosphate acyltransferase PlsY